jgi:hypothetical protein
MASPFPFARSLSAVGLGSTPTRLHALQRQLLEAQRPRRGLPISAIIMLCALVFAMGTTLGLAVQNLILDHAGPKPADIPAVAAPAADGPLPVPGLDERLVSQGAGG